MRVVLDANVLVSAIISPRGAPAEILARWQEGMFDLVISPPILRELDRVLHYPRIQQRYHLPEEDVQRFLTLLRRVADVVLPTERLAIIERDQADNRYLECALAGKAGIIVSGDRHLLDLGEYRGIQVLAPVGFLAILRLER